MASQNAEYEGHYEWVEQVKTCDAIECDVVDALNGNPGWRLLHVGTGSGGQTTLTYGWPWPGVSPITSSQADE